MQDWRRRSGIHSCVRQLLHGHFCVPQGTIDNSPAINRWGHVRSTFAVPQGTIEIEIPAKIQSFSRPRGTANLFAGFPSDKSPGYFRWVTPGR